MIPSKALLEELLSNMPADEDIPGYLAKELTRINRIKYDLQLISGKKKQLKEEYDKSFNALDKQVVEVQMRCNHEETIYYGDPAGGSDSRTDCVICGRTF